jgi:hypothetical protein
MSEQGGRPVARENCRRHPGIRAGWRCGACAAALCPDCTAVHKVARTETDVCATCGARVERLRVHRAEIQPLGGRLLAALRYPLIRSVGFSLLALAVFQAFLSYRSFGPPQAIALLAMVSAGAFWSYFFLIMSATASGSSDLGVPDFRDIRQDLVMPAWKGFAAGTWVWAPALVYLLLTRGFSLEVLEALVRPTDPVLWVIAALGAAYVPVALMAAATDSEILDVINPVRNAVCIYRMGRDYWLVVGALALLFGGHVLVQALIVPRLTALPIPFVCRVLAGAAGLYLPFVMARVLGTLLYLRGDVLDWGNEADYYEPALGKVTPRAAAPVAAALVQAPAGAPDELFRAGVAFAKQGDFDQATRSLKTAAFSSHPIAARAMVTLAQVYAQGLRDPGSAAQLYRETTRRFPDTDAARFAREQLQSGVD